MTGRGGGQSSGRFDRVGRAGAFENGADSVSFGAYALCVSWGVMEFDRTCGFPGEGPRAGRQQRLPLQQRPDIRLDQGRLVSSKTRSRRDLLMHNFEFDLADMFETTFDLLLKLPQLNLVMIVVVMASICTRAGIRQVHTSIRCWTLHRI